MTIRKISPKWGRVLPINRLIGDEPLDGSSHLIEIKNGVRYFQDFWGSENSGRKRFKRGEFSKYVNSFQDDLLKRFYTLHVRCPRRCSKSDYSVRQ